MCNQPLGRSEDQTFVRSEDRKIGRSEDRKIGISEDQKIGSSEDRKFVNRPYMVVYCSYQKLYNVCQVCIIRPSL